MKIIFCLGHPAHYHLFKNINLVLNKRGHETLYAIKSKDVLESLLQADGAKYVKLSTRVRGVSKLSMVFSLLKRNFKLLVLAIRYRPDLMVGTSPEIAHVGKLIGIKSVVVNEDDADIVPLFSRYVYPFADSILTPTGCRVGKWVEKNVSYDGFHELAYLHPKYFTPNNKVLKILSPDGEKYFIIRFAKLTAHHDGGKRGISLQIAKKIIQIMEAYGRVYITSERELEPALEKYRISLDPADIHSALYYADLYVGDSQTMAIEAAVLGTPSVRFNDFVGIISCMEELEHKHNLTVGIKTSDEDGLYRRLLSILNNQRCKIEWRERANALFREKIDVVAFMSWYFENYPKSYFEMNRDPNKQYEFK